MKRAKTSFIMLLAVLLFVSSFSVMTYAHEFSPAIYPKYIFRHPSLDIGVVDLTYYISNFSNSNYRTQLNSAINDWEWQDAGHVQMRLTSESDAQVRFYDSWDNSQFGSTAYAVTRIWSRDSSVNVYGTGWMGPVYIKSCKRITKNEVYVNIASQSNANFNNYDIRKTWAHEIGHCLGFDETNDGTQSIMKQGKGSTFGWSNYWLPQSHDRSDLSAKFKWVTTPLV